MTARDAADNVAEHPYFKLATRGSMLIATFVFVPLMTWMVSTTYVLDKGFSGSLIIQTQQQNQLALLVAAQSQLVNSVSELSVNQAKLQERLDTLKYIADRNYKNIDDLRDRIDRSNAVPDK